MEIYNFGCDVEGLYGYAPQAYDEMLRNGGDLFCLAVDDNHNKHDLLSPLCDSFGGFTMIEARQLHYGEIINALETGRFYSSMGPEIKSIYLEEGCLVVEASPVENIYVVTGLRKCCAKAANPGETITNARFELTGDEGYIRVDCKDKYGRHALSNAYFLDSGL